MLSSLFAEELEQVRARRDEVVGARDQLEKALEAAVVKKDRLDTESQVVKERLPAEVMAKDEALKQVAEASKQAAEASRQVDDSRAEADRLRDALRESESARAAAEKATQEEQARGVQLGTDIKMTFHGM